MIREADLLDEVVLHELIKATHEEAETNLLTFDWHACADHIHSMITSETAKVWVWDIHGEVKGSIAIDEGQPYFWSTETLLIDQWFAVFEQHRSSHAAKRLINTAKEYAEQQGLPLMVGQICGNRWEGKDRFYSIHGFKRVGAWYMKEE